jgi:hypothetical protein
MRNRILLTSTALIMAMGGGAMAQSERRDPAQISPPAASGAQSEPGAPAQKGRAGQPDVRQVPMQRQQQQPSPRAQDQRPAQPSTAQQPREDRPARGQGSRDLDRDRTTGQAPRGGEADRPAAQQRPQDREMRSDPPARAQERTSPQQPGAQGERSGEPSRAQAPSSRGGADVQITQQQRTQIGQRLASRDLHRIERSRVNFNIAIGATVPSSVRFVPLPSTIVSIVPQYRGYYYAVIEDEIVIIEPRSRRIVYVMPYGGSRASVKSERRVTLSRPNRDFVRKTVRTRPRVVETTGVVMHEIEVGEVLPETVVIEEFPDAVYRRVPELRSYRYIVRDDDIYLVDRERRVIEVID